MEGAGTLERALRVLDAQGLSIEEVHAMDEFTLDLLVPLTDELTLVLDTT